MKRDRAIVALVIVVLAIGLTLARLARTPAAAARYAAYIQAGERDHAADRIGNHERGEQP